MNLVELITEDLSTLMMQTTGRNSKATKTQTSEQTQDTFTSMGLEVWNARKQCLHDKSFPFLRVKLWFLTPRKLLQLVKKCLEVHISTQRGSISWVQAVDPDRTLQGSINGDPTNSAPPGCVGWPSAGNPLIEEPTEVQHQLWTENKSAQKEKSWKMRLNMTNIY